VRIYRPAVREWQGPINRSPGSVGFSEPPEVLEKRKPSVCRSPPFYGVQRRAADQGELPLRDVPRPAEALKAHEANRCVSLGPVKIGGPLSIDRHNLCAVKLAKPASAG